MYLHVEFDSGHARDIPVSAASVLTLTDPALDVLSLGGLACLYLTSDTGETLIGPGASAEAVARSVGWIPPLEAKELADRAAHLEYKLGQAEAVARELQQQFAREHPVYPVTRQEGGGEPGILAAQARAAQEAARLNAEADLPSGDDAVWADDEPDPVAA